MSVTLNWNLRDALAILGEGHRLNVLIALALRSNGRMRCFPSLDTLVADTGKSISVVNEAKKWLKAHGAFALVPYKLRVDEEKKLPVRQHVYQLTGILKIDGKVIPYLYLSPESLQAISDVIDTYVSESETSESETSVSEGKVSTVVKDVSIKDSADKPAGSAPRKNDPLFDSVAKNIFKTAPNMVNGDGGRIGAITSWLKGKKDRMGKRPPVGFIDAAATPEQVDEFSRWLDGKGFSVRDFDKFVENWREWRTSQLQSTNPLRGMNVVNP